MSGRVTFRSGARGLGPLLSHRFWARPKKQNLSTLWMGDIHQPRRSGFPKGFCSDSPTQKKKKKHKKQQHIRYGFIPIVSFRGANGFRIHPQYVFLTPGWDKPLAPGNSQHAEHCLWRSFVHPQGVTIVQDTYTQT